MSPLRTCVALCAALFVSSAAHADLIDFNSLHNTDQIRSVGNSLVFDGYTFGNDCGRASQCFVVQGTAFPIQKWLMDPTGAALENNFPYTTDSITRSDGASFNLQSIDFADLLNEGYSSIQVGDQLVRVATSLLFTFNYTAGGSSTQLVSLDDKVGGQTVNFAQTGLSSVTWVNTGSDFVTWGNQFDNVVVTSAAPVIAAVPEPSTWALMFGGLAMLGTAARRRIRV